MTNTVTNACAACKQPFRQHFQITRFDPQGAQLGSVDVCSVSCLVRWAYEYSTSQGMRLALGAQAFARRILETIKRP